MYKINIQRVCSGTYPEAVIELSVYDGDTLDVMFRGQMTFQNFASVITGQQAIPITVLESKNLGEGAGGKI